MSQRKGQDKIIVKEVNEVEIGNIPDKVFKVMIINLLALLEKRG